MRRVHRICTVASAVTLTLSLAAGAFAQQQQEQQQQQQQQQQQTEPGERLDLISANDLIGMPVENRQGDDLGHVEDIVLDHDVEGGRISYIALAYDAWLGIGGELHAIPFHAFQLGPDRDTLMLDIRPEMLDEAPGFDPARWPDRADPRWEEVDEFYGTPRQDPQAQQDPFARERPEHGPEYDVQRQQNMQRQQNPQQQQPQQRQQQQQQQPQQHQQQQRDLPEPLQLDRRQRQQAQPQQQQPQQRQQQQQEQQPQQQQQPQPQQQQQQRQQQDPAAQQPFEDEPLAREREPEYMAEQMWSRRLSEVIGTNVQDPRYETLGQVEDVVIDMERGAAAYGVVSYGGVLGVGEEQSAVPWTALHADHEQNVLVLQATEQDLEQTPFETVDQLADRTQAERIHQHYQAEPYWEVFAIPRPEGLRPEQLQGWRELDQQYDANEEETFEGTIESIGTFRPTADAAEGMRYRLRVDEEQVVTVYGGPQQFEHREMRRQEMRLQRGDEIEVTGSPIEVGRRTALLARQITKDDQTLELRGEDGTPGWERYMEPEPDRPLGIERQPDELDQERPHQPDYEQPQQRQQQPQQPQQQQQPRQ